MIEVRGLADLKQLDGMQKDRPEKVLFLLGEGEQVVLVKEAEGDMELACKQCYFSAHRTMCLAANCSEPESVFYRKIELED